MMNNIYPKSFFGVKNAGFTLIELLVVVLIIGILAAVAVPQYQTAVLKSRAMGLVTLMRSVKDAEEIYYMANGRYTNDVSQLDIELPAGGTIADVAGFAGAVTYADGKRFGIAPGGDPHIRGTDTKSGVLFAVRFDNQPVGGWKPGEWHCTGNRSLCKSMGGVDAGCCDAYRLPW